MALQKKIRVGVIMGGTSSERDMLLENGRNIFSRIPRQKFVVFPIFMGSPAEPWEIQRKSFMRNSTRDIKAGLPEETTPLPYLTPEPDSLPGMIPSEVFFHQAAVFGIRQADLKETTRDNAFDELSPKEAPCK